MLEIDKTLNFLGQKLKIYQIPKIIDEKFCGLAKTY